MSTLTTRSLDHALNGLQQRDDETCLQTIADEEEINQFEKNRSTRMASICSSVFNRSPPISGRVISAMKLSPNLERIGDESVALARRALKKRDKTLHAMNKEIARHIERIGDHATNIGEDAVYAAAAEDIRHQPFVQ
ncbi:MAG: PhoU domain-containing protein [Bradyrhizobium sp.]